MSGHGLFGLWLDVGEGQEFVEAAHGMAVDDLGEDIGQIGLRIDGKHFAGCDQRGQNCPMFATAIGAGEEMILAPERNGTDGGPPLYS